MSETETHSDGESHLADTAWVTRVLKRWFPWHRKICPVTGCFDRARESGPVVQSGTDYSTCDSTVYLCPPGVRTAEGTESVRSIQIDIQCCSSRSKLVDPVRSPANGELRKKSKEWASFKSGRCAVDDSTEWMRIHAGFEVPCTECSVAA